MASNNNVASFMLSKGYDMISSVRLSKDNKYPFVAMIDSTNPNNTECVWFSKEASGMVSAGDDINVHTTYWYDTENAQGEERIKFSFNERGDAEATLASRGFKKVSLTSPAATKAAAVKFADVED